MRKLLLGLLLLFLATDLFAQSSVRRRPVFPVSGGTWYGPTRNTNSGFNGNTTALMQSVLVDSTGNGIKLRVYVGAHNTDPRDLKLAIYNDAGTSLLGTCTITTYTENALNECSIASPPSLSSGTRYRLAVLPAGSVQFGYDNANSAFGFFEGGQTYASFPPATLSGVDPAGEDWAIQVCVGTC